MLLSLPVIAPEVPATIEFSPAGERHLRLVLAMSRLGMITDDDLASLRRTRMTTSAIRTLIERGWHRAIGGDYTYQMISAYARLLLPDAADEDFIGSDGTPLIGFAINASQPQWITIDKAFTAIESEAPGLGCAAIKILDSALCHFGVPHTPSGAFDMAQNLYWMGEEDETLAIEENGEDCDMPTRAGLFQGVPEWAYKTYGEERLSITDDEFAAHVERLADAPVGKMLAALLRLKELEADEKKFAPGHEGYGWANEPPVVCGWSDDADFSQIFDDNYRYYCEGGEEPPWIGCVSFEPSEQSISESLTVIRHTGSVLQALDKALIEIKEFSV
jgi:PRTRC genetic system protein F